MGWLKSLFDSDTIIKTAAKGAYNGIDMAVYTSEEKAIAHQKIQDWLLEYQKATAPQNLSRRYISMIVAGLWSMLVILTVALAVFNMPSQSKAVFEILRDVVTQPFSIIMGFYFLAHITKGLKK